MQIFGSWLNCNAFKSFSLVVVGGVIMASPSQARQMECSRDYITHKTTIQLEELQTKNMSVNYSYRHETSPVGGKEKYIFNGEGAVNKRGTGQLTFVSDKLFFWDSGYVNAIVLVNFEKAAFKEMQYPAYTLDQAKGLISTPVVVWTCQRTD